MCAVHELGMAGVTTKHEAKHKVRKCAGPCECTECAFLHDRSQCEFKSCVQQRDDANDTLFCVCPVEVEVSHPHFYTT